MTYRKKFLSIIAMILIMVMAMGLLAACGNNSESEEPQEEPTVEEPADTEDDGNTTEATTTDEPQDVPLGTGKEITVLDDIDAEDMFDMPLQIESATLYEDGSVKIVPTGDLLANSEAEGALIDGAIYPFKDSGKATEIYTFWVGNGGYRTFVALMEDGTVSALNPREIIENHKAVVIDKLEGRNDFVSVLQGEDPDAYYINGVTEDGEEVMLDGSLWG